MLDRSILQRHELPCGCVMFTKPPGIVMDMEFNCAPHKKMLEDAIDTTDDYIEEMIFAGKGDQI